MMAQGDLLAMQDCLDITEELKRINSLTVTPETLKEIVLSRRGKIESLLKFMELELSQLRCDPIDSSVQDAFLFCEELLNSPITIAVVGQINSGKSMLVSELIGGTIELPSDDEPNTDRITRLVYSDKKGFRVFQYEGVGANYKEFLNLEHSCSRNVYNSVFVKCLRSDPHFFEIGLPIEILRCGLRIIDFPGLNESFDIADKHCKLLREMKPSIILYVYDFNYGFSMKDAEFLDDINNSMIDDVAYSSQYILIANKVESVLENEVSGNFDSASQSVFKYFQEQSEIQHKLTFKKSNKTVGGHKWFKVDVDRFLTILPLSTIQRRLKRSCENDYHFDSRQDADRWRRLLNTIAEKILRQPLTLPNVIAQYIGRFRKSSNQKIAAWYEFKSLNVEKRLFEFINKNKTPASLILSYHPRGYKVFGMNYRRVDYLVTEIPYLSEFSPDFEKRRILKERNRDTKDDSMASIIFELPEVSMLLIEKHAPKTRLLDILDNYSFHDMENFIKQIVKQNRNFQRFVLKPNFRPDNIFVCEKNKILFVNHNIPNDPEIPLILKNGLNSFPFHLHPEIASIYPYQEKSLWYERSMVEFIYSFGCFVWILLEGSGVVSLSDGRNQGKFPNSAPYLKEVIDKCLNIKISDNWHEIKLKWNDIVNIILSNSWLREKSADTPNTIKELLNSGAHQKNLILDYKGYYQVFSITYDKSPALITCLTANQSNNSEFEKEKLRIYQDRKLYKSLSSSNEAQRTMHSTKSQFHLSYIYQSIDDSTLYLIELYAADKRLLDSLPEYNFQQIESFIQAVVGLNIDEDNFLPNFRPDCVYINKNREIYISRNIPNNSKLPFILTDCQKVDPPMHLHSKIKGDYPFQNDHLRELKIMVEFLCSFGWFVWLLLGGKYSDIRVINNEEDVDKLIDLLQSGHYPDYPVKYREVMETCWKIKWRECQQNELSHAWRRIKRLLLDDNVNVI